MEIFAGAVVLVYLLGGALIAGTGAIAVTAAEFSTPGVEMPAADENKENMAIDAPDQNMSEPEIR